MFQRQKPASVMDWAEVTFTAEETTLILIKEGVMVNQHVYLDLLKNKFPWVNATFGIVELFSNRMEPRPTQLIASRSGVKGT